MKLEQKREEEKKEEECKHTCVHTYDTYIRVHSDRINIYL